MTTPGSTVSEGQGWLPPDDDEPAQSPLDKLTSGIEAFLQVGITLGKHLDEQDRRHRELMSRLQRGTPVDYGAGSSGAFPASGALLLPLGTPDQGCRWEVTNVVVGGTDLNVAAVGTAGLYVGALQPTNNQTAPGGITVAADYASSLPNVGFYGTRQLVVNDQEYIFLIVFGGTVGQVYAASMSATVFNVAAAEGKDVTIL